MVDKQDSDKQEATQQSSASAQQGAQTPPHQAKDSDGSMGLEDLGPKAKAGAQHNTNKSAQPSVAPQSVQKEAVYDIPVKITAVIGSATMPVSQLIRLGRGAVVPLDRKLGEAVDIYANNRLIALGEVVVVDDNHIGVTMTEILSSSAASNETDS